jgi:hypothetical protein
MARGERPTVESVRKTLGRGFGRLSRKKLIIY